jgi:hypothetical protein
VDLLYDLIVAAHLLGMAVLIGVTLVELRRSEAPASGLPLIAAGVQVVTGIALAGLASSGLAGTEPNNVKLAVKLAVAVAVLGLAVAARRADGRARQLLGGAGLLGLGNVLVATLW